jgi:hypothetical protein
MFFVIFDGREMDKMFKFEDANIRGLFNKRFLSSINRKVENLDSCIKKVEAASNINFPECYIEPVLPIYTGSTGEIAVYYARTIPYPSLSGLSVIVEVSAALLCYSTSLSLKIILAHELLHYIELVRRMSKFELLSDEVRSNSFEAAYSDLEKVIKPEYVYSDKRLVKLVAKKFEYGFEDFKLKDKILNQWINKGKPVAELPPEKNMVRIPVSIILTAKFDPFLLLRIKEIGKKAGMS